MKKQLLLVALAAILAPSVVPAAPSTKEFAVAINQAGRQRMLSQKMSKEFLLVSLDVDAEANRAELGKTINLFDSTLKRLITGEADVSVPPPPTPEVAAQLEIVKTIWDPFRETMEKGRAPAPVPPASLTFMARESLRLVTEMDKAVTLYEVASQAAGIKSTGTVVNVAGRQRMLTQRMSKNMLLIALKVETETARKDLQFARDLFDKSLKGLTEGNPEMNLPPTTNKTILQQLGNVSDLWKRFSALVEKALPADTVVSPELVREVADLNVKLLAACQKVVSSYETETY